MKHCKCLGPTHFSAFVDITSDDAGKTTKIEVWFYIYDKNSQSHKPLPSHATMKSTVDGVGFNTDGNGEYKSASASGSGPSPR
jgi:hypothetical protein